MEGVRTAVIVDDDADVRLILRIALGASSFTVHEAKTGLDGIDLVRREQPDLITLDLNMPGIDGVETCRQIRDVTDAYIIMITSSLDDADRLVSLAIGADDYITKPFSPREVQARVEAMFRRPRPGIVPRRTPARGIPLPRSAEPSSPKPSPAEPGPAEPSPTEPGPAELSPATFSSAELSPAPPSPAPPSSPGPTDWPDHDPAILRHDQLVLDAEGRTAWLEGVELPLTRTEFDLLLTMLGNPRRVWRREGLLDAIWGGKWSEIHVVEVHMGNLRRKLDQAQAGGARLIKTVRGVGYRLAPSMSAQPAPPTPVAPSAPPAVSDHSDRSDRAAEQAR